MKKSRIIVVLLVVLMLVMTVLAGCAGDKGDSNTSDTPSQTSDTPSQSTGDWDFSNDKNYDLSFTLYLPEGNSSFDWINPLVEGIKEKTDGTVNIEVFAGGTLAAGDETADAIKNGVADMGLWPTAYALGTFPLSYMLEYPGIDYASAKAASYAFTDWLAEINPAEIQDFKVLFSYCSGEGIFLTSKKPIKTVADFKGQQIRTNAINAFAVEAYGGTPVTLGVGEVYEAMRNGIIDGYCGLTESLLSFKLEEVSKYAVLNPNFQCAFMVLMNKDVYESMSDGQRAVIDEVSKEVWEKTASSYLERDWASKAITALKDKNVEISEFSGADLEEMTKLTSSLLDDYAATLDKDGIDGTGALAKLKEIVAKYNDIYPTND